MQGTTKNVALATDVKRGTDFEVPQQPGGTRRTDVKNDEIAHTFTQRTLRNSIHKTVQRFADGSIAATLEAIIPARLEPTFDFVTAEGVLANSKLCPERA